MLIPNHIDSRFLLRVPGATFDDDGRMPANERLSFLSLGATAGEVRMQLGAVMSWRTGPGISVIIPVIGKHEPGPVEGVEGTHWLAVAPAPTSMFLYEPGEGLLSVEVVDALIERARRRGGRT